MISTNHYHRNKKPTITHINRTNRIPTHHINILTQPPCIHKHTHEERKHRRELIALIRPMGTRASTNQRLTRQAFSRQNVYIRMCPIGC